MAAFGVMAGILLAVAYAFRALELTIDDRALMLRVPEHVWMRLIVRLGRQRLEELLAADEAAVRRAAWAAFRERLEMEEWRA